MEETKYKQTEVGLIPEEWGVTLLEKVCTVKGRIGFRGYTKKDLVNESNGAITLSPSNIIDGILSFENCTYISWYKYFESPEIMAELGDIVFTKTASVGKTALIRTLPKEATINPQLVLLKNISCNSAYLSYILQDVRFQNDVKAETGQGCVPNVPQSVLEKIEVPLPPLTEQHAIASALTSVDNLIASLDKLIAKTQSVKQGTMQQLLTGKTRLKGFSKPWKEKKLGEVAKIYRGGSPRPIEDYITKDGNGINWIKIGDVEPTAKYITSTAERIKPSGVASTRLVYKGDLILSNSMSFGRPYVLKLDGAIHDGWLVIQNYQDTFDGNFLYYALCSENTMTQYKVLASGSSVQNLNKYKVATVAILVPSSQEEQRAIASTLTAIDDQISALEAKRKKYEMVKVGMMQQLLTGKIRLK